MCWIKVHYDGLFWSPIVRFFGFDKYYCIVLQMKDEKITKSFNLLEYYELLLKLWNNYINPLVWINDELCISCMPKVLTHLWIYCLNPLIGNHTKLWGMLLQRLKNPTRKDSCLFIIPLNDLKISMFYKTHLLTNIYF
jgi:hypothetical protein